MAFNSLINLPIPAFPDAGLDAKTAIAMAPLYQALRVFHISVSQLTGAWQPDPAEYISITPQVSLIGGATRRFYKQANVAITAGQLVSLNAADQLILAV